MMKASSGQETRFVSINDSKKLQMTSITDHMGDSFKNETNPTSGEEPSNLSIAPPAGIDADHV